MHKMKIGTLLFLSTVVLLVLHIKGLENNWYWHYEWYDLLMHTIGGIAVGLFLLFVSMMSPAVRTKLHSPLFLGVLLILGTFVVGVGWEGFEHLFNIAFDPAHRFDTAADLIIDIAGALIVYTYASLLFKREKDEVLSEIITTEING